MSQPEIVRLDADGGRHFRDVRPASLADSPAAFGSRHDDRADHPADAPPERRMRRERR